MAVFVITPPEPLVALDLAKKQLRVTTADEDGLIQSYIDAASAWIDGPDGILKRSIGAQTLEVRSPSFPGCAELPCGPVQSITEVRYIDHLGEDQLLDAGTYSVGDHGRLSLAPGARWPALRGDIHGVRVRYSAGYEDIPAGIQQAVLLLVGQWFRHRMAVNVGNIVNEMPNGVKALLAPYKVWRF